MQPFFQVLACTLLAACGRSDPGVAVQTRHDCNDDYCNVEIEIQNFGNDVFDIEYEISAYKTSGASSTALVGEVKGSHTVSGGQSITLTKRFRVVGRPNTVASSTVSTRRT